MSRIPDRSPIVTTQAICKIGRKANPKHTEMYTKVINIMLTGSNPEHLQDVAATVHTAIANHQHCIGGKKKRLVHAVHSSTKPSKIFDGCIQPDSLGQDYAK